MAIVVSSPMPSGNGDVVQSVTAAASLTFGSAEGFAVLICLFFFAHSLVFNPWRPRAGFLRGRKGSKCRRAKNQVCIMAAWVLFVACGKED